MARQKYDRSSKWLIEEQGIGLLRLAGVSTALRSRALQPEVVQPATLPDGLLQVTLAGVAEPRLYLIEVATYPEKRVAEQMHDDIMLVRQARGCLPEALVLVLREKGTYRVPKTLEERSEGGWTTSAITWNVLEVWTLTAEAILNGPDVGMVPLAPLAQFDGSPEVVLQRCRTRIDREGGQQQDTLLAVTQTMASLRFDHPDWLSILGGKKTMIESPLIQEIVSEAEQRQKIADIVDILRARQWEPSEELQAALARIADPTKLRRLLATAVVSAGLSAFEKAVQAELPTPSTRGKRRKAAD